jgi:hypothetical protein
VPDHAVARPLRRKLKVYRGGFAGALVRLQLIGDLLAFAEFADTGSLKCVGMDEHVLAAASRRDEPIASLIIVPFHCSLIHKMSSQYGIRVWTGARTRGLSRFIRFFGEASLNVRPVIHRRTGLVVRPNLDGIKMVARLHFARLPSGPLRSVSRASRSSQALALASAFSEAFPTGLP